jgi:hypothetical protein
MRHDYKGKRAPVLPYTGDKLQHFLMLALINLDACCGHTEWFRIGAALHSATEGSEEGLEAFDWWSSRCRTKYPGRRRIEYQWQTYGRGPGLIRLPTLIHYLEQEGVSWRELLNEFERNHAHLFDD